MLRMLRTPNAQNPGSPIITGGPVNSPLANPEIPILESLETHISQVHVILIFSFRIFALAVLMFHLFLSES